MAPSTNYDDLRLCYSPIVAVEARWAERSLAFHLYRPVDPGESILRFRPAILTFLGVALVRLPLLIERWEYAEFYRSEIVEGSLLLAGHSDPPGLRHLVLGIDWGNELGFHDVLAQGWSIEESDRAVTSEDLSRLDRGPWPPPPR